jgi:hypothetical protein
MEEARRREGEEARRRSAGIAQTTMRCQRSVCVCRHASIAAEACAAAARTANYIPSPACGGPRGAAAGSRFGRLSARGAAPLRSARCRASGRCDPTPAVGQTPAHGRPRGAAPTCFAQRRHAPQPHEPPTTAFPPPKPAPAYAGAGLGRLAGDQGGCGGVALRQAQRTRGSAPQIGEMPCIREASSYACGAFNHGLWRPDARAGLRAPHPRAGPSPATPHGALRPREPPQLEPGAVRTVSGARRPARRRRGGRRVAKKKRRGGAEATMPHKRPCAANRPFSLHRSNPRSGGIRRSRM